MIRLFRHLLGLVILATSLRAEEADWQWSVPVGEGRAFLWIPADCPRVRAVVVAQHNMIERGILQHGVMRRTLTGLGIAEVFIVPSVDPVFRFDRGAGERFDGILRALAASSGYAEIATAPVVPMGHSAHASFPWNYAAWNPGRTLAALSLKGDAPLTDLTGSGRPNPDWGERTLDGVPGLMVMGEYEWWEARLAPLLRYRAAHPAAPLALLAEAGHGHFEAADTLVEFLALFLRKAAAARLPADGVGPLRPVDPAQGWLMDRWRGDEPRRARAAPYPAYAGDRAEAFWCFDEEMADAIEATYATSRGKQKQQVGYRQNEAWVPISNTHGGVELKFLPEGDGLTFRLTAGFIAPLPPHPPVATKDQRPPTVTVIPVAAGPGTHAPGSVGITPIIGPVAELAPGVFRVAPDRMFSPVDQRTHEMWFYAHHPGDATFKGAVQQALLRLPHCTKGAEQKITFPPLTDQRAGPGTVALAATSSSGLPVGYYVREGPACVRDGVLHLTPVPPRARWPVKVTVVAWQFGRETEPMVQAAPPVERTFLLTAP